jgi:hypothetical protein
LKIKEKINCNILLAVAAASSQASLTSSNIWQCLPRSLPRVLTANTTPEGAVHTGQFSRARRILALSAAPRAREFLRANWISPGGGLAAEKKTSDISPEWKDEHSSK